VTKPEDAHARPSGQAEDPLYDLDVPTPSHAERARSLAAQLGTGTLCTRTEDPEGYPYGSFVTFAFDGPDPVFLVSALAEHTKNLKRDPRASLLVAESGASDPLANGRVTLLGPCRRLEDAEHVASARAAFLAAHPGAAYYVDFKDFGFWKLRTESIRYIGGYGRMSWVDCDTWRAAEPDPLASVAAGIVSHMNDDHADSMVLLCKAFSKAIDVDEVRMTSIDRYGFEMSAVTPKGPRPVRLAFDAPVHDTTSARVAIVAMVKAARAKLAD
jgi:hypothetical protein